MQITFIISVNAVHMQIEETDDTPRKIYFSRDFKSLHSATAWLNARTTEAEGYTWPDVERAIRAAIPWD